MSGKLKNVENAKGPTRMSQAEYLFDCLYQRDVSFEEMQAILKADKIERHNKHSLAAHFNYWGKQRQLLEEYEKDGVRMLRLSERARKIADARVAKLVAPEVKTESDVKQEAASVS